MEKCRKHCKSPLSNPISTKLLNKKCNSLKGVATKVLRIPHLANLERFYKNTWDFKFRVIQLVRDPRSMQISRIGFDQKIFFLNEDKKYQDHPIDLSWHEIMFISVGDT